MTKAELKQKVSFYESALEESAVLEQTVMGRHTAGKQSQEQLQQSEHTASVTDPSVEI
ncbi:MAG TPA: hypothetical protein VHY48_10350 [Acidobacteriaceae bacterium]|jgi:hypothetical protein|nr:hypothetical protein [Acidobacteriaceae bacterium]